MQGKNLEVIPLYVHKRNRNKQNLENEQLCICELADASQFWYLKVREELYELGVRPSQLDQGLFIFHNQTEIVGIVILFVNGIIWTGQALFTNIINKFKIILHIETENTHVFTM